MPRWRRVCCFKGNIAFISGLWLDERDKLMGQSAANFAYAQMRHAGKVGQAYRLSGWKEGTDKMLVLPWGWSASESPSGDYLGWGKLRDEVVTPHASSLALQDFPAEVVANLRALEKLGARHPRFGFYDAVDVKTGNVAENFLVLDQSMLFLSLVNFLRQDAIRSFFQSDPMVQQRRRLIADYRDPAFGPNVSVYILGNLPEAPKVASQKTATARTASDWYRAMANEIADWLTELQDNDGGMWGGYKKSERMGLKSTEGNLDAYAALTFRPEARARVKDWLWKFAWLPEENRFRMGSTSDATALDTSAWGVLALGEAAWPSMRFAEKHLRRRNFSDANGKPIEGFADFADKERIWLEGTGEMACAYAALGCRGAAARIIRQLEQAMIPSQVHPNTMTIPCFTNDPSWDSGSRKGFVPSVCWYLFAKWNFNPMQGFQP